jgi:hypothetical protein
MHLSKTILCWILRLITVIVLATSACVIVLTELHVYHYPTKQGLVIVDIGFEATRWSHEILHSHLPLHHCLALLNTFGLCTLVLYTVVNIGYWQRQPGMLAAQIGIFIARLLCGWIIQLPYSPEYFASEFDLPDLVSNILNNVLSAEFPMFMTRRHSNFFSFFSGHIALVHLLAIHFYRRGRMDLSLGCHVLNGLQIMRFLATRGHYTIDIIGGIVAGSYAHSYVAFVLINLEVWNDQERL